MHTVHVWYNKSLSVIYSNVTPRFLCNAELWLLVELLLNQQTVWTGKVNTDMFHFCTHPFCVLCKTVYKFKLSTFKFLLHGRGYVYLFFYHNIQSHGVKDLNGLYLYSCIFAVCVGVMNNKDLSFKGDQYIYILYIFILCEAYLNCIFKDLSIL